MGQNSPGPTIYGSVNQAKVKERLSMTRYAQKFSVPRQSRFHDPKLLTPGPNDYKNTTEVITRTTLRASGKYSIPQQARHVDFTKFSALHSSLVEKGYY